MRFLLLVMIFLCALATTASSEDMDSDSDGLSDFQEIHKYLTDPQKGDSDADGKPDGGWQERREYTYTIRSIVKVLNPVNEAAINDDYQDARVLSKNGKYVEMEVIHYPYNTVANSIQGVQNWQKIDQEMQDYLKAGITTNWDSRMKKDLLKAVASEGMDPDSMTDADFVRKVAQWLISRAQHTDVFGTYYIDFPNGKARIMPGLEQAFREYNGGVNAKLPLKDHLDRELFGKGMYDNQTVGTCTSTAIYLATCMRALGIPCRMILVIPIIDPSDPEQVEMIGRNIKNHRMRKHLLDQLGQQGGFIAHTFNEVHVGGHWHRLNYSQLGANIDSIYGLATHVNTFNDLSEANLARTWGWRFGKGEKDEVFEKDNPFRTTALSDEFGVHSKLQNPKVEIKEHKSITISKVYWQESNEAPEMVKKWDSHDKDGFYLLIHGEEWFEGEHYTQYKRFMQKADPNFSLVAKDHPAINVQLSGAYFTGSPGGIREFAIRVSSEELAKMAKGIPYQLVPNNSQKDHKWRIKDGLSITKPNVQMGTE